MNSTKERLARNQALFREVNERIEEIRAASEPEFVCECSDTGCIETIHLMPHEYERVRSDSLWFMVRPGHEHPEIERIVRQEPQYLIVEKLVAVEDLEETDPRSTG